MFPDLSLEVNHIDSHISSDKNWFYGSNQRSLLSEFELWRLYKEMGNLSSALEKVDSQ
jgi:hypothetical protein